MYVAAPDKIYEYEGEGKIEEYQKTLHHPDAQREADRVFHETEKPRLISEKATIDVCGRIVGTIVIPEALED